LGVVQLIAKEGIICLVDPHLRQLSMRKGMTIAAQVVEWLVPKISNDFLFKAKGIYIQVLT
jgi:hypothetical protein